MKISSNIVPIFHQELIRRRSPSDGIHTLSTPLTPSCHPQLHVQPGPLNLQVCYPCLDISILFFQKAVLHTRMYCTIQGIYPVFYSNWNITINGILPLKTLNHTPVTYVILCKNYTSIF